LERLSDKVATELDLPSKSVKLESNPQNGYYFRISRKVHNIAVEKLKNFKKILQIG
jgi:hypothetical protein